MGYMNLIYLGKNWNLREIKFLDFQTISKLCHWNFNLSNFLPEFTWLPCYIITDYLLSWPKSLFGFSARCYEKPKWTFWSTQYDILLQSSLKTI